MASLNKACILGNVGKDPEIKTMNSGDRVANLSIATSETWKDKTSGDKKEATEWHRITVWGPLVDVIDKYVTKGSKLYVEGKIVTRKYEQNGVDKYATEIVLRGFDAKLIMLDGKKDGGESRGGGGGYAESERETFSADLDDQIPFATNRSIW